MRSQENQIVELVLARDDGDALTGTISAAPGPATDVAPTSVQDSRRLHSLLKNVLRKSCLLDLLSRATAQDRVEILLYHGFCPGSRRDPQFPKLMPIEQFEDQVRVCARYLPLLSLQELFQPAASGVMITFDDGYANNFDLAFPVLQKYRCPATIFLTTGFLDQTTPLWGNWLEFVVMAAPACDSVFEWRDAPITLSFTHAASRVEVLAQLTRRLRLLPIAEIHEFLSALEQHLHIRYDWGTTPALLRPLTWDHVRTMRHSGLVSFGCHTVSHPVLSSCSRQAQASEIVDSKRRIEEELGESCTTFAYPYGKRTDYTEVTTQIVQSAGFELAVSAEPGSTKPSSCNRYEVPRWGADLELGELSFLVSGGPLVSGYLKEQQWR